LVQGSFTASYEDTDRIGGENTDELTLTIIAAILNGVSLAIGMIIGTRMTGDTLEKKLKKMVKDSPTAQRLLKTIKKLDKLFGDDQAVENITGFFKEARELVGSPEAKNFFTNVTELMKQLSTEKTEEKVEIKMPTLPGAADDKGN
jgi:uncharacterized protein YneF (UPF0154 family)